MKKINIIFYSFILLLLASPSVQAQGTFQCQLSGGQCIYGNNQWCTNGEVPDVGLCSGDGICNSGYFLPCIPEFSDYLGIVALVATIGIIMLYTKFKKRK